MIGGRAAVDEGSDGLVMSSSAGGGVMHDEPVEQRGWQQIVGIEDRNVKHMAVGVQVEDDLSGKPIILNDHLCYRPRQQRSSRLGRRMPHRLIHRVRCAAVPY